MTRLTTFRQRKEDQQDTVGLDSAEVIALTENAGLAVYDTIDSLPISSLTAGDEAYVKANNRLYISNGSGWYNVALINLSPTMTLDPTGSIVLSTEGVATTVTITASDSDNPDAILSYSVESDGNGIGNYTVSQDSSVFTITPLTEDSGASAATFTLTFKTTDNINTATATKDFSLTFSNVADSSSVTAFLLKSTGNSADNSSITYQDSADASFGLTETTDPQASTFTPYRSGGYSAYFDGTGDYLSADLGTNIGDGDFTVECWVYIDPNRSTASRGIFQISNTSGGLQANATTNLMVAHRNSTYSYNWVVYANSVQTNTSTASLTGQWQHVALVRSGSSTKLYIDGTSIQTISDSMNYNATRFVSIGGYYSTSYLLDGYIRDFRVVKGTAVYTSDFTPPTEALTAVSGTELLTCYLPYFGDGSTNGHTITVNGNTKTAPFGPYDFEPWSSTDHIGSAYLDTGDRLQTTDYTAVADFGADDFTVEGWYYQTATTQYQYIFSCRATNTYRLIAFLNNNTLQIYMSTSGSNWEHSNTNCGTIKDGVWTHVALVRNGGTITCYLNGVGVTVTSSIGTDTLAAPTAFYIASDQSGNGLGGYVSDFRVVKGTAVYTSNFTPPTTPLTAVTNTKLLMQNKTDVNFYDAAATDGVTLSTNSPSTTSSVTNFVGSSSLRFDNGESLSLEGLGDDEYLRSFFALNDTPWTIEYWIRCDDVEGTWRPFGAGASGATSWSATNGHHLMVNSNGSNFYVHYQNAGSNGTLYSAASLSGVMTNDTWHHHAWSWDGTTQRFFIDGNLMGSTTNDIDNVTGGTYVFNIGRAASNGTDNGGFYLQDFRITKGLARYTAAFTPPTTEFSL